VISDRDDWAAALLIVKRYGDDAMLEASERADQLLEDGDMAGAETWHRILDAIERLQAKAPAEGRRCIDAEAGAGGWPRSPGTLRCGPC
jgi:triphosphoribosyl-dephospho-CoA synthetase